MEIVEGKLGAVGDYDLEVVGGKVIMKLGVKHGALAAALSVELDAVALMDVLAAAIPGTIDDAVLGVIKAALLAAKA